VLYLTNPLQEKYLNDWNLEIWS